MKKILSDLTFGRAYSRSAEHKRTWLCSRLIVALSVLLTLTACNSNEPKAESAATTVGKAIVENIMTRTSIRQYTDQAISADTGLRSTTVGYQYSEIIRAIVCVFLCGGSCVEDLCQFLKDYLVERPHTRVPSVDTVLRGISELATENISYTAETSGNTYDFNTAASLTNCS